MRAPSAAPERRLGAPLATLVVVAVLLVRGAVAAAEAARAESGAAVIDLAPPFGFEAAGRVRPLWTLHAGARVDAPTSLTLADGAAATSPSIAVTRGVSYRWHAEVTGPLRIVATWEDPAKRPVGDPVAAAVSAGTAEASSTAPADASALRLRIEARDGGGTVRALSVGVERGTAVERFPDFARAALAFSFDWESAMGGLIHARSNVTADGSPSIAKAEAMGRDMREGAQFLLALFDRYGIRGSFYATGYDLLRGNPRCEKFVGDPTYAHVDAPPWHSNYWQNHPWYGHDPCTTEARAPAWYFASATRELVRHGEEIGCHTFGHLLLRGASAAELAADLKQWTRSARALGLPPARSFSFPWTASEGVDAALFPVLGRFGFRTLVRLHQPLPHPYELDRVPAEPDLVIFPDVYVRPTRRGRHAAIEAIDDVLARRGVVSPWTHPNEIVESADGEVIWREVVTRAAARRGEGLWIAPVSEIVDFALATERVVVTSAVLEGRTAVRIENRSGRSLRGLTLTRPAVTGPVTVGGVRWTDVRGAQIRLPQLAPGQRIEVVTAP
jgi:peptidoglycan/xylan/chitin deacetylase (PgdA/CDA1 family)